MTQITSLDFLAAANASESGIFPILLFTITHADLAEPILFSTDPTSRLIETDTDVIYGTTSNGNDYLFFPLSVKLPGEPDQGSSSMQIEIDNVARELTAFIRSISSPPSINVDIVLSSDVDTVLAAWPEYLLVNANISAETVSGELVLETLVMEPFPAGTFNPSEFPGMF